MAKAQGKKAIAVRAGGAGRKAAGRVKSAAKAVRKAASKVSRAVTPKKTAGKATSKPAPKAIRPAPKAKAKPAPKARPAKSAPKAKPARPAPKAKPAKPAPKAKPAKPAPKAKAAAKPVKAAKVPAKAVKPAPAAKAAPKPAAMALKPERAPAPAPAPKVLIRRPVVAPAPAAAGSRPAVRPAEGEKKRGRRPRPRIQSSGVPVAAWLSTEKPRPASFIPAPPRAEAPSAVAAPPASSDRLIRPEDLDHAAVRTVPVRIDIEQGAGKFYVIASPIEVVVKVGEGIEWDFRYLGGADVSAEEVVIEFPKPSPFGHTVFRTKKPGGARPHRQLSGAASAPAAGKRIEYRVRALSGYKVDLAATTVWVTVTA